MITAIAPPSAIIDHNFTGLSARAHKLPATSQLAPLYRLWSHFENAPGDEENRDRLSDFQGLIMGLMETIPCESLEDIFYKLAIWRRDCLGGDIEQEDRGARLAYSALCDIAAMTGLAHLLNEKTPPTRLVAGAPGEFAGAASPTPAAAAASPAAGGAAAAGTR